MSAPELFREEVTARMEGGERTLGRKEKKDWEREGVGLPGGASHMPTQAWSYFASASSATGCCDLP